MYLLLVCMNSKYHTKIPLFEVNILGYDQNYKLLSIFMLKCPQHVKKNIFVYLKFHSFKIEIKNIFIAMNFFFTTVVKVLGLQIVMISPVQTNKMTM
jgi:hypothetical protein